ncbi:hypothetical protein GOP47_0026549 [Adiantum capillus-veneris]|nr:hypothetical protein GOP47_0026549 [Adiantum capillus-veneris]
MSYRVDRSPKVASKVPPMYSPRIDGGGLLASRVMPPSPLSKGLDGPAGPLVDYDDVFGGPPRFAASVLAAQASQAPSVMLDRSSARTPSFRSPSLPVFDLPVFGDDVFGSSNTYEPRPVSVAYDDIFREEVQTPDVYQGSVGLYRNRPQSKATSRSSSRRMSPVHPAASLPEQLLQEEILAAANTAAFFKDRSNMGSRNSFSSPLFDEGRSNSSSRKDRVGLSLPSSPPHTSTRSNANRFTASNSANNLGASRNGDVDDVFGGFPQRTYALVFPAANHDASTPSRTHSAQAKGGAQNKPPRSPFTSQSSESFEGLSRTLSSSSSSDGDQELQDDFIEIRMDRQSDSTPEQVEAAAGKTWVTASDLKVSSQSTPNKASARPPPAPAPASQLKHKSWKDWTSDLTMCQPIYPASSSIVIGVAHSTKKDLNNGSTMSQHKKGLVEVGSFKRLENNSAAQQPGGKYTLSSPLRTALKGKPLEETMELEERELQAMLNSAWKMNENREQRKITAARQAQDSPSVFDFKLQEPLVKEEKRQPSKLPKAHSHQQGSRKIEDREAELHWKSWRKHSSKERTDALRDSIKVGLTHESKLTKAPVHSAQDVLQERIENPAMLNALSEAEDPFDPEEIVKVVAEEVSANGLTKDSDRGGNVDLYLKSKQRGAEDVRISGNEKPLKVPKDENETARAVCSTNSSLQDFVQYSELQEEVVSEGLEEIDSLIGMDPSMEGFQDIEGESLERRKSRWLRHLRSKERVAKALEEMQQRDAEVQRQQEEKQQLSESADRQIKRWATGKEGNLRALLSNLQHVLWPESGWQPISLTGLIEGPDVKKAYRKATLFVHPDKMQQKGATLQQKYIAERVFDILQEAWKTFNLQELF